MGKRTIGGEWARVFWSGAVLVTVLLAGCQNGLLLPSLKPYKIDIQQGNFLTQEMVSKLKPGMTRSQVRFVLGTPLIVDPFHDDRWDYVYRYKKAGKLTEKRRITVVFDGDRLARIEGDVAPSLETAAGEGGTPAATKNAKPQ